VGWARELIPESDSCQLLFLQLYLMLSFDSFRALITSCPVTATSPVLSHLDDGGSHRECGEPR
jgi:hypothetical protein